MLLRRSFVSQRTGRYNRREAGLRFAQQQNIDVSLRGEPDKVLVLVGSALSQHACMLSRREERSSHMLTLKKQRQRLKTTFEMKTFTQGALSFPQRLDHSLLGIGIPLVI